MPTDWAKELNGEQKPNFAGFVVIGAGLPRTGTNSLRTALNIVLDGAVYHMFQVAFGEKVDALFWQKALKRKLTQREWKDFLEGRGFRGGVDFPISMFYKDLMDAFPEAKVILTIREPETWYESVKNSIYNLRNLHRTFPVNLYLWYKGTYNNLRMTNEVSYALPPGMNKSVFGVIGEGKEASVQFYTQWVEHVKATVPKEKLLIFNVKEGWKPLCEFLDLPIPNQPFPRTNDTAAMQGNVFRGKFEAFIYILGIPIITGLFFYHFFGQKLMKFLNWGA